MCLGAEGGGGGIWQIYWAFLTNGNDTHKRGPINEDAQEVEEMEERKSEKAVEKADGKRKRKEKPKRKK